MLSNTRIDSNLFKWVVVFILFFAVGFFRAYLSYQSHWFYFEHSFRGVVNKPPQASGLYQTLTVKPETGDGAVKITTRAYPRFKYGDLLEITTDTPSVLGRQLSFPSLKLVDRNRGNLAMKALYTFREQLLVQIDKVLPEPHASLLAGVVFGIERSLGRDLDTAFREAGLVHIVVASGFNVTVVMSYLANLIPWIGRRLGFTLIILGVVGYSILTGLDPPIVRAVIMGLATLLAVAVGRKKQALLWLFFAAAVMLIVNPLLFRSLSFQMSFMATLALILFQQRIERYIYFFPRLIRGDAATTLAVQILILPLTWYIFGRVAPASILVNTLTLWVVPLIMPLGMLAILISFASSGVGWLIVLPTQLMLGYVIWIVQIFT